MKVWYKTNVSNTRPDFAWPGNSIVSPWGNKQNAADLFQYLGSDKYARISYSVNLFLRYKPRKWTPSK